MLTRLSQMASNNPNKTRAYITPDNNPEADTDGFSPNPTPVDQLMDPAAPHNQTPPAGTAGTLLNGKYFCLCIEKSHSIRNCPKIAGELDDFFMGFFYIYY